MKKSYIFVVMITIFFQNLYAKHLHKESFYQKKWCNKHNGIIEYRLQDKARVDCLLPEYAIEFDFANKWAESIGQALYYGLMTNRKPAIAIIIENREKEEKYLKRLYKVTDKLNIKVFEISFQKPPK